MSSLPFITTYKNYKNLLLSHHWHWCSCSYAFIILDDTYEKDTRHGLHFVIVDFPVSEVRSRTIWCLSVLIPFNGNFIFSSLKLWKLYHSFLFLLNIPILFQLFICIILCFFSNARWIPYSVVQFGFYYGECVFASFVNLEILSCKI